jgi:hypothetical protein
MKKRRGMTATQPRKKHPTLAAAVMVLHQRVEKLEQAVERSKPRRIGFDAPDVIQGEVVPMTTESDE